MIAAHTEKQQSITPPFTPESPPKLSLMLQMLSVGIIGETHMIIFWTATPTELLTESTSNSFDKMITVPEARSAHIEKFINRSVKLSFDSEILFKSDKISSFKYFI